MDGISLAEALKDKPQSVLFLSAYSSFNYVRSAYRLGAEDSRLGFGGIAPVKIEYFCIVIFGCGLFAQGWRHSGKGGTVCGGVQKCL